MAFKLNDAPLATQIKETRKKLDMSQAQAAVAWNVPVKTLQKWEQGLREPQGLALDAIRQKLADAVVGDVPAAIQPQAEQPEAVPAPEVTGDDVALDTPAQLGEEAVKLATEIKLRAERKAGEILRDTPKQAGARGIGKSGIPEENSTPTLADIGVTPKESSRFQKLASIPAEDFEPVAKQEATGDEVLPAAPSEADAYLAFLAAQATPEPQAQGNDETLDTPTQGDPAPPADTSSAAPVEPPPIPSIVATTPPDETPAAAAIPQPDGATSGSPRRSAAGRSARGRRSSRD